jgi:hypothetical protein
VLSFEVWINGNKEYTVGSSEAEEFGVYLSIHPELQTDYASIEASGYIPSESKFSDEIKWGAKNIKQGDDIEIKVVESDNPDVPSRTQQHVGLVPESNHGMLCSNCGKSHMDIQNFVRAQRITLCDECIYAIIEAVKDEKET